MDNIEILENNFSNIAEVIEYTPDPIDEYIVIVNDVNDWEEIHNYIINENEIDGIPNRKIECVNLQEFSLRTAIYLISQEEANILRTHQKIESVELNPDKYPQPSSIMLQRFANNIAFNKPLTTNQAGDSSNTSVSYTNGVRGNWSHLFLNNPSSLPFRGVGVTTTTKVDSNLSYTLDGSGVDAVIIDSGVAYLHPEFLDIDGNTRVKDVILDGPYKVDPDYFNSRGLTYTKIVDGVNVGVGINTANALEWWSTPLKRSVPFQSLGTAFIDSRYTLPHVSTKTTNSNNNQIIDGHGTACASQIGGKSFGLAFKCNIWNIRIALSGTGGYLDGTTALNVCAIFHNAKKISQNNNPDPTLINNSWGNFPSTGNTNGTTYTIGYRGNTQTYVGTGNNNIPPANSGSARNNSIFYYKSGSSTGLGGYATAGGYLSSQPSSNTAAENAIAAGCIVVAAAGNMNQKFSNPTDIDYNNWYAVPTLYLNRVQGVQKGGSGDITKNQGSIRVGALDCAVEPFGSTQGANPYSVRKVCYSNNGPMINVWAPGEMTMAAGYGNISYERYVRSDNSAFYDTYFNGTSAACPNACSLIALYLQGNRSATTDTTRSWLESSASIANILSDPYPSTSDTYYWASNYLSFLDNPILTEDSYNLRGCGNLRGATNSVLTNPFSNYIFGTIPTSINEGSSGTFNLDTTNISNGTTLYWTINHITTTSADFSATSGSFTINSNTGSFNITTIDDSATEGGETFTVSIRTDSTSGTVVAISNSVTINDTSVSSASYIFSTIPTSINEGSSGTFNLDTTNISNGTTLYWTINHINTTSADFNSTSGSFIINSNAGSFNITTIADSATEGGETFTVSIRTDSTSGTVVAISNSVTINDTSVGFTADLPPLYFASGSGLSFSGVIISLE